MVVDGRARRSLQARQLARAPGSVTSHLEAAGGAGPGLDVAVVGVGHGSNDGQAQAHALV